MSLQRIALAALVLLAASSAGAAVIPIDQFTGEVWEGFENIFPPGSYPELPLFSGQAAMKDALANMAVIAYNWQGPGGEVVPYNGNLMGGAPVGTLTIDFVTPVTEFGGMFTTVGSLPDGTVNFLDAHGGLIDSLPMSITPATWLWQGWSSDTPASGIEIISNNVPGCSVQCDDFQANFVPEPGTLSVLAAGAGLLLRRRR